MIESQTHILTLVHGKENDEKHSRLKVGDHVKIPKYKYFFAEGNTPNWSEEVLLIKKVKNTTPWTHVI